jgi:hypothetical protein
MNALFVGFNRSYTNPTAETQLKVIGSITNLDFFGPGFVNNQDLLNGIEAWSDKKNMISFLLIVMYLNMTI